MTNLVSGRFVMKTFFLALVMVFVGSIALCNGDVSADDDTGPGYISGHVDVTIKCTESGESWNCWSEAEPREEVYVIDLENPQSLEGHKLCANWYIDREQAYERQYESMNYQNDCVPGDYYFGKFHWADNDPQVDGSGTEYSKLIDIRRYSTLNNFTVRYDSVTPVIEGGYKVYRADVDLYKVSYWMGTGATINEQPAAIKLVHREPLPVTATVVALETGGNRVLDGSAVNKTVLAGNEISLSMTGVDYKYIGYTWDGWGSGPCAGEPRNNCSITIENDKEIYAYYLRNKFQGRAQVSSMNKSNDTGWVDNNKVTKTINVSGCEKESNGKCEINFKFDMQKKAGNGKSPYKLWREVNNGTREVLLEDNSSWPGEYNEYDFVEPGGKICWGMTFDAVAAASTPAYTDGAKTGEVVSCVEAEAADVTLTVKQYEKGTNRILNNDFPSKTVKLGDSVRLSVSNYAGYTWDGWGSGPGDACAGWPMSYCVEHLNEDRTVKANYIRNKFQGRAQVSSMNKSNDTGWVDNNKVTKTINVSGCEKESNGKCEINFKFDMQKKAGNGKSPYKLWREVNNGTREVLLEDNSSWPGEYNEYDFVEPGGKICWGMTFDAVAAASTPAYTDGAKTGEVVSCVEAEAAPVDTGFQGKIDVSGGVNHTSEYTKNSRTDTYDFRCTNTTNGCAVTFNHFLKGSTGSTIYSIKKRDNTSDGEEYVRRFALYSASSAENVYSDTVKMKPGMKICESLSFSPGQGNVDAKVCVVATGNTGASLSMNIKNDSANEEYHGYSEREGVYAKPGDTVDIQGLYRQYYQYALNIKDASVRVEENGPYVMGNIKEVFEQNGYTWKNAFSIEIVNSSNQFLVPFVKQGEIDDSNWLEGETKYKVLVGDVGRELSAVAETNKREDTSTAPKTITFGYDSGSVADVKATIYTGSRDASAFIRVPYNYENSTKITNTTSEAYAIGEKVPIKFKYSIKPRKNSKTTNDSNVRYATSVDAAKWKLVYCIKGDSSNCDGLEDYGMEKLLSDSSSEGTRLGVSVENMSKTTTFDRSGEFEVPDVPVGTVVCVKSAIYPASSGSEDNYDNPNGDGKWAFSTNSRCFTVAKNPSFQVWGGNVHSAAGIEAPATTKNIKVGENSYEKRTFGSWAELALVMNVDKNKTLKENNVSMASGAGLGKSANPDDKLGGNSSAEWERYNTLTYEGSSGIPKKEVLLGMLNIKEPENASLLKDGIVYENPKEVGKRMYFSESNFELSGNIEISGRNTESYSDFGKVPNIVVYVEGDINIKCDVERIDAVLIATKTINTCSDGKGSADYMEKLKRTDIGAHRLTINGMLSADRIEFNRTIGASKDEPGEPAEIINFDTTLLMLGMPSSTSSGPSEWSNYKLEAVRDAAPRV